jgi:hypothetical protein
LFEGFQTPDRVVKIRAATDKVLRPGGDQEILRRPRLNGRTYPLDCKLKIVDRVACRILDSATAQPNGFGLAHGLRAVLRR